MALIGGDIVDAGVEVIGIIPWEKLTKVFLSVCLVDKSTGVFRHTLNRAKDCLNVRIIIGGSRTGKYLGHLVILEHLLDDLGLHLTAPVVDHFRTLIFGEIEDVFVDQAAFNQALGFICGEVPADKPADLLAGVFVDQQVEIKEYPLGKGSQIADIPAPALIGAG